jgi:hypothetical protein
MILAPTASATLREQMSISIQSCGGPGNGMTSLRLRSAPSPLHCPTLPDSSLTRAGSPDTVVTVPGSLSKLNAGLPFWKISTSIVPGCSDCSGGPHPIALDPVVQGGDSD